MSVGNPVMRIECGVLHGNHQPSCKRQMSPAQWWAKAEKAADTYVAAHPVRPYGYRMDARSEAMAHIINRAREHPRAGELLKLIYDAGWIV